MGIIIKYKLIMGQDDHQFSRHHGGGAVCAIILFSLAAYYFYTYSALSDKNPDMFVQGNKLTCWADPAIALPKANFYISINDEAAPTGNYVNVSASFTQWMSYQFYICISMIASSVLLVIYSASHSNLMLYASGIIKSLTAIGSFINLIWGAIVRFGAAGTICSGYSNQIALDTTKGLLLSTGTFMKLWMIIPLCIFPIALLCSCICIVGICGAFKAKTAPDV